MAHRLLIRDVLVLDPVAQPTGSTRGYLSIGGDLFAWAALGRPDGGRLVVDNPPVSHMLRRVRRVVAVE